MDGIILLNKPSGITSHDLVFKARKALNIDKIGHTGTLDPLANGLMILTIGKATKILPFIAHHQKEYVCTMKLGLRSDSWDSTGEILETRLINPIDKKTVREVLNSFIGDSKQLPPMYSAKKINGKKLYDLARKNIEVERKEIDINISDIELISLTNDTIKYRVVCSTGTYIRSLCQDIAKKLNNIAVMSDLQRTKIDRFLLENACSIDDLYQNNYQLIDSYDLLTDYPYIELNDTFDVLNGKRIKHEYVGDIVMMVKDRKILAAYMYNQADGYYYSKRGLF